MPMISIQLLLEIILGVFLLLSTMLYIYCQYVLYTMLRRKDKEKLSSYLFIVFFAGFVNLAAIAIQVFFQLLPTLMWQTFFYSLGSIGARLYYMVFFGGEIFVISCEGFIAISRYLAFCRGNLISWSIDDVRKWLLGLLFISAAYAASFLFCPFQTYLSEDKKTMRFSFGDNAVQWVSASIFVPFTLATISFFSCVYCYYKVATIIKATSTGLARTAVARMCLSSTIISFGVFLSLLLRMANNVSYLVFRHDAMPFFIFYYLVKVGILIATCGNPWILLAFFPTVCKLFRQKGGFSLFGSEGDEICDRYFDNFLRLNLHTLRDI